MSQTETENDLLKQANAVMQREIHKAQAELYHARIPLELIAANRGIRRLWAKVGRMGDLITRLKAALADRDAIINAMDADLIRMEKALDDVRQHSEDARSRQIAGDMIALVGGRLVGGAPAQH